MNREFTRAFKSKALKVVEEQNGDVNQAADILKIPARLLACWTRRRHLELKSWEQEKSAVLQGNNPSTSKASPRKDNRKSSKVEQKTVDCRVQPLSQAWNPEYRRRHGLIRRPYPPENFKQSADYKVILGESIHSIGLLSKVQLSENNSGTESLQNDLPKDVDNFNLPPKNVDDAVLPVKDSGRLFDFLTSVQSLITDTLKLKRCQIGTVYPIEVEMSLPDAMHDYCDFNLLNPLTAQSAPESVQFNVLLSATASGTKLKPLMVIEGEVSLLQRCNFPPDVHVLVTDNTAFDMKIFTKWKRDIWLPAVDAGDTGRSVVILPLEDKDFLSTPVFQNVGFLHENSMVAAMPKNLIDLVHPAIVFWIQPFAEVLRVRLLEWLKDAEGAFETFRQKRTADYELFAGWVCEAWKVIDETMIVDSFEVCGLTNFTPKSLHPELQQVLDRNKTASSLSQAAKAS